jgi:hypothetical protein
VEVEVVAIVAIWHKVMDHVDNSQATASNSEQQRATAPVENYRLLESIAIQKPFPYNL